jgi:hypothetical protein
MAGEKLLPIYSEQKFLVIAGAICFQINKQGNP